MTKYQTRPLSPEPLPPPKSILMLQAPLPHCLDVLPILITIEGPGIAAPHPHSTDTGHTKGLREQVAGPVSLGPPGEVHP